MKFIVTALSFMWALAACAEAIPMQDPLLALSFDPGHVKFEAAPDVVLTAEKKKRGTWYLFAKYADEKIANRSYLLVSGMVEVYGDTSPQRVIGAEPDFGFVAQCDGMQCRVLGVPDRMFDDLGLPHHAVVGLATDAVSRLITAFGGKDHLQKKLDDLASAAEGFYIPAEMSRALQAAGLDMKAWKTG
ncbi:hypothetical protein HNQ60_000829 [Povalibacter uvarum]|uniref:Uncharacterized protein n=1 Tax=Povalibacter uvarum TaxID=732238 RepID=A0A841HH35_9GAMM|nr:hypothetical protein [Povalibacter uvarum]MBB6091983.1 hypothetical protein [Povalibacter uvarum]